MEPVNLADEIENLMKDPDIRRRYGQAAYDRELSYKKDLEEFLSMTGSDRA